MTNVVSRLYDCFIFRNNSEPKRVCSQVLINNESHFGKVIHQAVLEETEVNICCSNHVKIFKGIAVCKALISLLSIQIRKSLLNISYIDWWACYPLLTCRVTYL